MAAELEFPKVDGDLLYGSEASAIGICSKIEAGENISEDDIVYIKKSDGKAYISDTGTADDIRADGIAMEGVSSGSDISIQKIGTYGITCTAGEVYYLGAAGAISTTKSAVEIGVAIATDQLFIQIIQDDRDMVGTVKAYVPDFTGMPSNNVVAFWVECNGQSLSDAESALNGQTIPDLNGSSGTERFLRGQTTSGGTGGSETHAHSHNHEIPSGAGSQNGGGTKTIKTDTDATTASTLPSYYEVVWMMKVK